jgi:hypothetical protein
VLAILVIAFFVLVDWSTVLLIGTLVAFALAFLAFEFRGQKCPHCGGLVLGGISEDLGISLLGPPPSACQSCGRSLADL